MIIYQTNHLFRHDEIINNNEFFETHLNHEKKNFEL